MSRDVVVNCSFEGQRTTGQQRYASEISRHLLHEPRFLRRAAPSRASSSALASWAWVQTALPVSSARSVLLSMTSRAPVYHPRHVVVVHDLFVLTNPEWFSRAYHLTHAPLLRAQLRSAAAVVAVSEATADEVRSVFDGPVTVAPNAPSAVFREGSRPDQQSGSTDPSVERPDGFFLAVGSLEPRKNLARLAQAYGRLPGDVRSRHPLVVVGARAAIYQSEAISWPDGTVLRGFVTDEELASLYGSCHAVVMVSRAEGFGLPLVEAAAAGAPRAVVSDLPVFRWICGDSATYVDPLDVDSMAGGLLAATQSGPSFHVDQDRFDWGRSATTIRDLCREIS